MDYCSFFVSSVSCAIRFLAALQQIITNIATSRTIRVTLTEPGVGLFWGFSALGLIRPKSRRQGLICRRRRRSLSELHSNLLQNSVPCNCSAEVPTSCLAVSHEPPLLLEAACLHIEINPHLQTGDALHWSVACNLSLNL